MKTYHPDASKERKAWMLAIKRLQANSKSKTANFILYKLTKFGNGRIKRYESKPGGL